MSELKRYEVDVTLLVIYPSFRVMSGGKNTGVERSGADLG